MLQYKILRPLAEGGQKKVYLARLEDGTKVVVKIAPIYSTAGLQRMVREVSLLRKLNNPYFPKNYDASFDIASMKLITIEEFINGETLQKRAKEFNSRDKIKKLLLQLTEGLEEVWERNIVHRDLKPANILIKTDGKPCIIDFGIARFLDMDSLTNSISPHGPATPLYAAPEQMNNKKNLIDMRTDFYAIGIITLELYLGIHPFDPSIVSDSEITTLDNMKKGKYATSTPFIKEDPLISNFASHLLQRKSYMRPRNYEQLRLLINNL